jgi:hypothetical protein
LDEPITEYKALGTYSPDDARDMMQQEMYDLAKNNRILKNL